jgi:DNA anti-recombination protein RmuC
VYLAIAVSARVNIVYKRVAKIVKDVRAIDNRLSKLKGSLSKIKDKLAFIRRGITTLIYNTRLLDIELK